MPDIAIGHFVVALFVSQHKDAREITGIVTNDYRLAGFGEEWKSLRPVADVEQANAVFLVQGRPKGFRVTSLTTNTSTRHDVERISNIVITADGTKGGARGNAVERMVVARDAVISSEGGNACRTFVDSTG